MQRLAKLRRKQDGRARDGDHVRDGLGQIHGGRLIGQQRRQQIDQRQQQHEFAQHGHDDRAQRAADGHERHLACDLDAEQKQPRAIDAQHARREGDERRVRREDARKQTGGELDERPERDRVDQAHPEQQAKRLAHACGVFRAEVVARDRLRALPDALQRQHGKLHHAREDRHRADGDVAAVLEQGGVEAHGDDALARLHRERRQTERHARQDEPGRDEEVLTPEVQKRLLPAQERQHPRAREPLREHGRQRRAAHTHVQREDKDRVENDVRRRTDEHRVHTCLGKTLRRDEGVHAERELDKERSERINMQVVGGIADGVLTRAEGQQRVAPPEQQRRREHDGDADLHREAAAERLFGAVHIVAPHVDRRARRAAGGCEAREGRHDQDDRQAHAHARQRAAADLGNVADVDAVDDVVEHIHELRDHRRDREPAQKPSDRLRAEKCFVLLHSECLPMCDVVQILRERRQAALERLERVGRDARGHLRAELLLQGLPARDDGRGLVRAHEAAAPPVAGVACAQQIPLAHELVNVKRHDARLEPAVRADVARGVQPRIVGQKEQNVHGVGRHVQLRAQRLHDDGVGVEDAARVCVDLRCGEHGGHLLKIVQF